VRTEGVQIKGTGTGLRVTLPDSPIQEIVDDLRLQLRRKAGFFAGANVSLVVPSLPFDLDVIGRVQDELRELGMHLHSVNVAVTEAPDLSSGARRDKPARRVPEATVAPGSAAAPDAGASPGEGAIVVRGTVRSGQRVSHRGSVVVVGDVNPGGEVIAGRDVVVWGRLRGVVQAGLEDPGSIVAALDLAPTQLRIGPCITRAPDDSGRVPTPEVARMSGQQIVVRAWPIHGPDLAGASGVGQHASG
jgi:septum site-determining protein MinC